MITKIVFMILAIGLGVTYSPSIWVGLVSACVGYTLADIIKRIGLFIENKLEWEEEEEE